MGSQQAWVEHRGESGRSGCSELGIHREEVTGKSWPRRCPASSQKEVDSSAARKGGWAHDPGRNSPQVDIVLRVTPVFHPNKALRFAKGVFLPEKILKCNFL